MSRLIASILLSTLLFPLGAILYVVVFFLTLETRWSSGALRDEMACLVAGVVTSAFVGWYWVMLWRKTVNWNAARRARTRNFATAAVVVGVIAGTATGAMEREFGFFIASVTPPLLWMVATVLVWRETDAERTARLRANGRADGGIPCPACAYDMTGLKGTRCPECGSEITIDELIASQPGKAAVELER
jgi:signal transduction histidine kinase